MNWIEVSDNRKNLLETAAIEANSVINFFNSNGLVNNADKAAVLYNCKGKSEVITIENVGGENLVSTYSEKLLGLYINPLILMNIFLLLSFNKSVKILWIKANMLFEKKWFLMKRTYINKYICM